MGSLPSMKVISALLIALALVQFAHSQSVKSCGSSSDRLKNAVFSVSPDPVNKNAPLTINAAGDLDAALSGGTINADLNIKALGIINEPIKASLPWTLSPSIPAGPQKVVIGPFSLPKVPGSASFTGTVKMVDASGKSVFCLELDTNLGGEPTPQPIDDTASVTAVPVVTDCGTDADHMHNRTFSQSGGVVSAAGTLDEDITSAIADVDLEVKVSFFTIPIKLTVPVSISPGIKKGPIKATAGPSKPGTMSEAGIKVSVSGNVKINDAQNSEVVCLSIATPKL